MTIKFEKPGTGHLKGAVDLVTNAYSEERKAIDFLPAVDYSKIFSKRIKNLFLNGSGVVAIQAGKVVGFLGGYEIKELWGNCKGVYCPIYGHGALMRDRRKIYQNLYKQAAGLWVDKGITNHSITLYAQDQEVIDTWFWLGFGLRCVDAIRELDQINVEKSGINIKKVKLNDVASLVDIDKKHNSYYKESPIFMPVQEEDTISKLTGWLSKENHHMWMAYDNERVIGYMRIEPNGERFLTEHQDIMNITGAYVEETYRGQDIGSYLLDAIQKWLKDNKYKLCGVDYESINIAGSKFWNKHFIPYTYSLVRRIDERSIKIRGSVN